MKNSNEEVIVTPVEDEGSKEDIRSLFHDLWTKAVGTQDYDKSQWQKLQVKLWDKGISV